MQLLTFPKKEVIQYGDADKKPVAEPVA